MKTIFVQNWKTGWKWFSNWAFMLIIFIATVPIPPEILSILPDEKRNILTAVVAFFGLILRFINQSKPEPPKKRTRKTSTTAQRTRKPRVRKQQQE